VPVDLMCEHVTLVLILSNSSALSACVQKRLGFGDLFRLAPCCDFADVRIGGILVSSDRSIVLAMDEIKGPLRGLIQSPSVPRTGLNDFVNESRSEPNSSARSRVAACCQALRGT
jgi:hypothetical protein